MFMMMMMMMMMVYFYSTYDVFAMCLYTKSPLLLYSTPGRDEEGWRRTEAGGAKGHSATKYQFCVKNNMYGMYNSIEITIYNW